MATITPTASGNVDALSWRGNDTLVINNGYTMTVNTTQPKGWNAITINNGKLRIENASTSVPLVFRMTRGSGLLAMVITPSSGLGAIEIDGDWIEIGTGDNTSGQAFTLPYRDHVPAIWVETAAGSGVYNRWANCLYTIRSGGESDLEGFSGYGSGVKGNVFKQAINGSPVYHTVQTNCTTSTASRNVIVTSTAGIFPGAQIVGSVGIAANAVVERVIDATTLEMNALGTANSAVATVTIYNTYECWTTDQITVGDGTHGNKIPTGAKVRVPNILLTGSFGINIGTAGLGMQINLTNGGLLTADTCLFSNVQNTFTTPQTLSLKRVGFSFPHAINKAYGVVMEDVCFSCWPQYPYLNGGRFIASYAPAVVGTTSIHQWTYITGTFAGITIYNPSCPGGSSPIATGVLGFAYADGITVSDLTIVLARDYGGATQNNAGLVLQYVYRSNFSNLQIHGINPFMLYASSGNTMDGINWSAVARSDYVVPTARQNTANFFGIDPATGADFVDGTPYFFKARRKYTRLAAEPFQDGNEYCIVPYYSSNLGFFNEVGFTVGNNLVVINWDDRRPTHTAPAFEIYRSTTAGVPVRDAGTRIFTTNTVTTLTYTDSTAVNGTRYYYVLRKYYSAGVFEDTPVWDCTPAAPVVANNYMLQSRTFSNAQWVKSNVTAPANADVPGIFTNLLYMGASGRRLQVTLANGTITNTVTGLTIGLVYTASVWVRFSGSCANAVAAVETTGMRLTWGTAFLDFNATNTWTQQIVTFTATATSHAFVLRFNTSGNWVDVENCMVNLGGSVGPGVETTTAALTTTTWDFNAVRAMMQPWGSDHNAGGYVNLPTFNTGTAHSNYMICASTTRGFTPSYDTEVCTSDIVKACIILAITSSDNVFRNFTQQGKGKNSVQTFQITGSCNDNVFENFDFDYGQSGYFATAPFSPTLYITTDSNRNVFRNFDIANNIPNFAATRPVVVTNDSNGTVLENFRIEPQNTFIEPWNNSMVLKGVGGGNTYYADALTYTALNNAPDSVPVTFTGVYDTHFLEAYHSDTTGALNLFFTASTSESPPYTLTGTAAFSNTGLLYLQAAGDSITYTWPHKIYGVSGFRNIAHLAYTNDLSRNNTAGSGREMAQSLLIEFQVDTGSGFSAWAEALPATLNALSLSASGGFYLKLRLTARAFFNYNGQSNEFVVGEVIRHVAGGGTATVEAVFDTGTSGLCVINSVTGNWTTNTAVVRHSDSQARASIAYVNTSFALGPSFNSYIRGLQIHTTVDQTVVYPSDPITLTVTGLLAGSDVTFLSAGTETVLLNLEDIPGTTADYIYFTASGAVDVAIYKPGHMPEYVRGYTLTAADASLPVTQTADPSYLP